MIWGALTRCYTPTSEERYGPSRTPHRRDQLSGEERATLERWARRHSSSQMLALRSKIVLACAAGEATGAEIAAELGCNAVTVSKWRNRFAEGVSMDSSTPPSGGGPHDR